MNQLPTQNLIAMATALMILFGKTSVKQEYTKEKIYKNSFYLFDPETKKSFVENTSDAFMAWIEATRRKVLL